jgi:sugar lactone lactonase YvrE
VAVDAAGNLFISEFGGHRVLRMMADGTLRIVAGNGNPGGQGDGALATSAELAYPAGIAIDALGVLYIADSGNRRIRRVVNGRIDTLPLGGFTLNLPTGVANDGANGIYLADSGNRKVLHRLFNGVTLTIATLFQSARATSIDGGHDFDGASGA